MAHQLSESKQFAFKVFDCFDELARPEIKNVIFEKMWSFLKSRVTQIILKKPDNEINESLLKIHHVLGPHFKDVDLSVSYQEGIALGSPEIPNVGELAKKVNLTKVNENRAIEILSELNL